MSVVLAWLVIGALIAASAMAQAPTAELQTGKLRGKFGATVGRPQHPGPYKVKNLQAISGPSPFAAGCPRALFDDTNIAGRELEPAITVNPANPRNIIATWKQDVGSLSPGRSDLIASSLDGGKTWERSTIPRLTACTGGSADTASDPWVSAGGDGTVYFGGQSGVLSTDPPSVGIVASHSNDGGAHGQRQPWSLHVARAMRRLPSPRVRHWPGTPIWAGPTSS